MVTAQLPRPTDKQHSSPNVLKIEEIWRSDSKSKQNKNFSAFSLFF